MTNPTKRRTGRLLTLAACMAMWCALPAMAQEGAEPGIRKLPETKPWVQWVAAALFTVGILAVAFKNPHRTHLD